MKFDKHYFVQFKDQVAHDQRVFNAHYEEVQEVTKRCTHVKATIKNNELRCSCGAAWSGPLLSRLLEHLQTSP